MPAAVSDGQIKAPEAPLYEQLLGLPARQRPAHDGGLYRSAQESTRVPKILCLLYFQELSLLSLGVGKRSMRDRFVEKTAGEGRQEVLVGASFRDVSVEDALKKEMIAVELLTNGALDWGLLKGGKTQKDKGNINS